MLIIIQYTHLAFSVLDYFSKRSNEMNECVFVTENVFVGSQIYFTG